LHSLITDEGKIVRGEAKEEDLEELYATGDEALLQTRLMIEKGYRAQLKTGSLLTGQLYIDVGYYPDAPVAEIMQEQGYTVFPTTPAPLEQIVSRVDNILKKVDQVPFDKIGKDLQISIESLTQTLNEFKAMSGNINQETIPKVDAVLDSLQETMKGIDSTLGPDSALNYNARQVTNELSLAIRSMRSLLEYLERDPQALILGKKGDKK